MKLLAKQQQESYENSKICYICKEKFEDKCLKEKKHCKFTDHVVDSSFFLLIMYHAIRSSLSKLSRILGVTKQLGTNLNNFWL